MADIVTRIQLEVLGELEVKRLTAALDAQEAQFKQLASAMQAAGASQAEILAKTSGYAGVIADLRGKIDATRKSTRDFGQAGLTAGRSIQDFVQGGIGGILNNIEGL